VSTLASIFATGGSGFCSTEQEEIIAAKIVTHTNMTRFLAIALFVDFVLLIESSKNNFMAALPQFQSAQE
jgi:hypothetical protein